VSALLGPAAASAPEDVALATDDLLERPVHDRDVPAFAVTGLRSELLSGVDLEVFHGECVCVLGLTGSGREELAYAAAGAVASEADTIEVEGKEVARLDPSDCRELGIALVPGNRLPGSMVLDFSLRENLSFASLKENTKRLGLVDRKRETAITREWIERFDIKPDDPEFSSRHMSGGNKQKMILAKWLNIEPSVMIIDEPTAGVDVGAAKALLGTLRVIADGGAALLVSTSEIDDALAIADRIVILHEGRIRAELRRGVDELTEETVMLAMAERDEPQALGVPAAVGANADEPKGLQ
ncbi:MAG TPA: ATP-binding cassette domain-containing protein, partial [Solirubrobacteraceae bacterium]